MAEAGYRRAPEAFDVALAVPVEQLDALAADGNRVSRRWPRDEGKYGSLTTTFDASRLPEWCSAHARCSSVWRSVATGSSLRGRQNHDRAEDLGQRQNVRRHGVEEGRTVGRHDEGVLRDLCASGAGSLLVMATIGMPRPAASSVAGSTCGAGVGRHTGDQRHVVGCPAGWPARRRRCPRCRRGGSRLADQGQDIMRIADAARGGWTAIQTVIRSRRCQLRRGRDQAVTEAVVPAAR